MSDTASGRSGGDVGGAFADRLSDAMARAGSPVCVGLDPVLESLPRSVLEAHHDAARAIESFSLRVLDAVAPAVAVVKLQSACYERYGSAGFAALERVITHARGLGLLVIVDAKRGDIGISASHYAAAAARLHADAVTVNGYLGPSGVEPFLAAGLGVFVLVRTSNPDSDAVQSRELREGGTVAELMAGLVESMGRSRVGRRGLSSVGAVVGATKAADGRSLRALMPDQPFLVPGYGAQGGTADDIRALVRPAGAPGVLVTASRSVIYARPEGSEAWERAVARSAKAMADEVAAAIGVR